MTESRRRVRASTLGFLGVVAFLATFGAFVTNSAQAVGTNPTTTTLASNANPAVYGQSVSLTAVVAPVAPATATPTGTVTFVSGVNTLGTRSLVNGAATYTTTYAVGTKSITATYNGNTSYAVSTSDVFTEVINVTPTATTVTASANPANLGNALTFTATTQGVAPGAGVPSSGSIKFYDGTTLLGSKTPASGIATFTTSTLSMGNHNITASFFGSASYAASTSPVLVETVNAGVATTSVSSNANPSDFGSAVVLTATVTSPSGTPTGSVAFSDGSTPLGTASLSSGVATLSSSALSGGAHDIIAAYSGDATYGSSSSASLQQMVNPASTATAITSDVNPTPFGSTITFTTTVSSAAGTPSGTVTISDGVSTLGTAALTSGTGTFTTSGLNVSSHSITATYTGSTNFASSTSSELNEVVNPAATVTTLTASVNPAALGDPVTLTATVASATPGVTGTVTFSDGASPVGTASVTNGSAAITTTTLTLGTHSLTAVYGGTASFSSSSSAPLTLVVNDPGAIAATTTALASSANPAPYHQPIDLTATVTGSAGTPSGTVHFFDGAADIGSASITSGHATVTTSTLNGGSHVLTATYLGDGSFSPSTSAAVTQTINPLPTTSAASATPNRIVAGQLVTTTATVTASTGTPSGLVTFRDGTTIIGTATLSAGQASLGVTNLAVGAHTLSAAYAGDGNFASSAATATATILNPIVSVDRNNPSCSNSASTAGSAATPFCSINSAAAKVSPGQTVQVAAGTYAERVVVAVGGSAGLPVTFTPAPGAAVTISGVLNAFTMTAKNFVTIHGFAIDHTSGAGIVVTSSSNITVDANHVTYSGLPANGSTAPGIKLTGTTNSNVTSNTTDHNSDAGILVTTEANNTVVAHNESFANARVYTRAAAGIDLRNSTGLSVFDNRTHDNEDSGINVWTGLNDGSSTVSDNVSYSNGDHGIDVHNAVGARIVANTVVGNSDSGIEMTTSQTVTLNNNISVDNGINSPRTAGNIRADKAAVTGGCVVDDDLVFLRTAGTMIDWNGVKYTSLSAFRTATGMESRGIQADPLFTSAAGADFHLLTGSPAIDTANTGATGQPAVDYDGAARFDVTTVPNTGIGPVTYADRGAFEYHP